jgi:hypothetical protein
VQQPGKPGLAAERVEGRIRNPFGGSQPPKDGAALARMMNLREPFIQIA